MDDGAFVGDAKGATGGVAFNAVGVNVGLVVVEFVEVGVAPVDDGDRTTGVGTAIGTEIGVGAGTGADVGAAIGTATGAEIGTGTGTGAATGATVGGLPVGAATPSIWHPAAAQSPNTTNDTTMSFPPLRTKHVYV
jgi:hypothetical protein